MQRENRTGMFIDEEGRLCIAEENKVYHIKGAFEPSVFFGISFFGKRLEVKE